MASMYDPLRDKLKSIPTDFDTVQLTYEQIDQLIQSRIPSENLPRSAYKHPQWWDNNSHTQSNSWRAAGFKVNMKQSKLGEYITFVRDNIQLS